jgi:hypothetical protein
MWGHYKFLIHDNFGFFEINVKRQNVLSKIEHLRKKRAIFGSKIVFSAKITPNFGGM